MFAGLRFRQDDELRIFAQDRSWCVDCTVITADPGRVVLSKPRVIWSGQDARTGIEWQDDHHKVEWTGRAYGVFRKGVGNCARVTLPRFVCSRTSRSVRLQQHGAAFYRA
jgi:hypothetical protein